MNDFICIVQGDEVLVDHNLLNSYVVCKKNKKNYDIINVVSKIKNDKEYKSQSVIKKALVGENDYIFNMIRKNNLLKKNFLIKYI